MYVRSREYPDKLGSQPNALFNGLLTRQQELDSLRNPRDAKYRRRSELTGLTSVTGQHPLKMKGDLDQDGGYYTHQPQPQHQQHQQQQNRLTVNMDADSGAEYDNRMNIVVTNSDDDSITCGSSRFSEALLGGSHLLSAEYESNRNSYSMGPVSTSVSRPRSSNSSLGHLKNPSFSNISVSSLPSHKRMHSNMLHLAPLRQEQASSSESLHSKGNQLAKQFLETATKTAHNKEPTVPASAASTNGYSDSSGMAEFVSTGFIEKLFPMGKTSNTAGPRDGKEDLDRKKPTEHMSVDFMKHIEMNLTAVESRLKHFLKDSIRSQELEMNQKVSQLQTLSGVVQKLHNDIKGIRTSSKTQLNELKAKFDSSDPDSFIASLTKLVENHVSRLETMEKRTTDIQSELEAKKQQLRKLENLIKVNDMINDFKRNMKLSKKLKKSCGTLGDIFVLGFTFLLIVYLFKRWFASE